MTWGCGTGGLGVWQGLRFLLAVRVGCAAAGFATALITAAAAAITVPASPWLVLTGTAAVGAALIAASR